jgi:hypothetical protein
LFIQLPEIVLALVMAGAVLGAGWLIRRAEMAQLRSSAGVWLLVFAVVFPVIYIIAKQSIVYDAARHVIFVLPPIACLAGLTLAHLSERAARFGTNGRVAAAVVVLLFLLLPARAMVALHPYQYVYFNDLAGGLPGAASRYETDYWAQCYREAVHGLSARLASEPRDEGSRGPFLVYVIQPWVPATYFFPAELEWTREVRKADFAISLTRYDSHTVFAADPVYVEVSRLGIPLCYVFDRRARR